MSELQRAALKHADWETISLITERIQYAAELVMDASEFGFTLIFGYLVASYYIGARLNRIQVFIFNTFFVAVMIATQMNIRSSFMSMVMWFDLLETDFDLRYRPVTGTEEFYLIFPIFGIAFTSGCLYFMWSVRNHKIE